MGLLSEGSPLSWPETKKLSRHVRRHGITQFLNQWPNMLRLERRELAWGDEIEYTLLRFDDESKRVYLLTAAHELLPILQKQETEDVSGTAMSFKPEYAGYAVEGTPAKPFNSMIACFNTVEANMRKRREQLAALLGPGEAIVMVTAFPRLGTPDFTWQGASPTPTSGASHSFFFPDSAIYLAHPRFRTLTSNIRQRRGKKVAVYAPIFRDKRTPSTFVESIPAPPNAEPPATKPNHIYMDAMGFGMGLSCLQVTFQCTDIDEARFLYDMLAPLCPIGLALSAASPIYRGYMSDWDARWSIISQSVDDRTDGERGVSPLQPDERVIAKSRYDSIDSYLSPYGRPFNDLKILRDEETYQRLRDAGVDEQLSAHIGHLFIRDPVSIFSEKVNQDDETDFDHFENIQSTNWQTMRFKPPLPGSGIGFRVEFRPFEVQLSDFENAAYVCFIVLLTRVIMTFGLNFIIPISKVDDNMKRALRRDACRSEKFWFRTDIGGCVNVLEREDFYRQPPPGCDSCKQPDDTEIELMSLDEIVNGKEGKFAGLVGVINNYLATVDIDVETRCTIGNYLDLIRRRASGKLYTTAQWMRQYVDKHAAYQHDSVVSPEISYDLMKLCADISAGRQKNEHLLNCRCGVGMQSKTVDDIPTYIAENAKLSAAQLNRRRNGNGSPTSSGSVSPKSKKSVSPQPSPNRQASPDRPTEMNGSAHRSPSPLRPNGSLAPGYEKKIANGGPAGSISRLQ